MISDSELEKIRIKFIEALEVEATLNPKYQEIVKALRVKATRDTTHTIISCVLSIQTQQAVSHMEIDQCKFDRIRYDAAQALHMLSTKTFEVGMQTNPIQEKDRRLELTYIHSEYTPMGGARETITLPIAVHPSVQKGQIVMNPEDYIELIRNSHGSPDCSVRVSTEIKTRL